MQIFNRTGIEAAITCEFNSNVYNSGSRGVKGSFSLTIPHCVFVGFLTKNLLSDDGKGIILQIFTDTQLSSAERTFILKYENENLTETTVNMYLDETYVNRFTNDMSGAVVRFAVKNDDITKANVTAAAKPLYMYTASMVARMCGYSSGYNTIPDQTDFKLIVDNVPCVCFESTYTYPANVNTNLCEGHYLTRTDGTGRLDISNYYYVEECYNSWLASPNYGYSDYNNFCRSQMFWLWVVANGDLDTNFDITDPFQPYPTDFYITVNANSDHEQKGEQSVNFTWEANNSDDIDLSNITLHFQFTHDDKDYQADVSYTDEGYACTYRDLLEKMQVPWWKNIIQKIPLIGSQLSNSTIAVNIWWSNLTGNAGKCVYRMEYDGRDNVISTEKAQDSESGYWTYLTAEDEDINQSPDTPNNPYDDDYSFTGGTDSVNGSALLTTSYGLSVSGAHDFGTWLWGTGFDLDQLKMVVNNPIENVVACKLFPFSVSGNASTVKIGNLTSPIAALYLPENVARTFDFGSIIVNKTNFPNLHGNFLDYAPFTSLQIYLPYLGFHELDTDLCIGASIGVKYFVDFVTGSCRAIVTSTASGNTKVLQSFDGNIGQDVPITASNRAQVEAGYVVGGAQAVASFASGIGAIATGNVGGGLSGIGNAITGGLQTAMQMYHSYTSGTPSPALSRFDEQRPYLIMDCPVYTEPKKYAHQNGHMCNLDCLLSTLHGYTVVENTVDLSSIPCNFEEREALLELLTSGIYL